MKVCELVDQVFSNLEQLRLNYHNRFLTAQGERHKARPRECYEELCKLPMQTPEAPWPIGDMECV